MGATVDDATVRHVVALLREERSANELTAPQKLAYLVLNVSAFGWLAFLLLAVGTLIAWNVLGGQAAALFTRFLFGSAILGFLTPLALLLNVPLLLKAVARWRRLRELGLERRPLQRWSDKATPASRDWLAVLLLVIGVALGLSAAHYLVAPERTLPGLLYAWLFASSLASIGFYFIRRGRARLKVIEDIASLELAVRANPQSTDHGTASLVVSPGALEQLTRLERAQIQRARRETILESVSPDSEPEDAVQKSGASGEFPEYAIKISTPAASIRNDLPAAAHRALSEVLDQVAADPGAFPHRTRRISSRAEIYLYTHPRPRIEITYEIDRDRKLIYFVHFALPQLVKSRLVFISYSHRDADWLARLRLVLAGFESDGRVSIWSDERIQPGDEWRREIERALSAAGVAILLVSQNFLASRFISEHELPGLFAAADERDLRIIWIAISASAYADTAIEKYQSANDPRSPLDTLDAAAQNIALIKIYEHVRTALDD